MGKQRMNIEEKWHRSETLSTQLRATNFETQEARQLEWKP